MSRLRVWTTIGIIPVFAAAFALVGCGGGDKGTDKPQTRPGSGGSGSKASTDSAGNPPSGGGAELVALKGTGVATIKGKVTYDGTPPAQKTIDMPASLSKEDKDHCLKDPDGVKDHTWVVGPDKGVANVVVWLKAPRGKYFDIPPDLQKPEQMTVKVDQPFCQYLPHVSVTYPSFYDGQSKKQKRTGQVFEVSNSAPIAHNTSWAPSNELLDDGANKLLPKKTGVEKIELLAHAKKPGDQDLLTLKCQIHQWMTGYVWAFDNPWAAVTDKNGNYEIKNAPAGVELFVAAWHEPDKYVLPEGKGSKEGEKMELKPGDTKTLDFKVSQ
jgi:hypothetical protein